MGYKYIKETKFQTYKCIIQNKSHTGMYQSLVILNIGRKIRVTVTYKYFKRFPETF